nr:hypothetical protein [Tanacetum cinerariifolium]
MEEVSLNIDEPKLNKIANEMLRQRCTSGDEHQYHIDQMKNFLKSDIVWESQKEILASPDPQKTTPLVLSCQRDPEAPALSLINQDLLYLKKGSSRLEKIVLSLHKFPSIVFNDNDIEEQTFDGWISVLRSLILMLNMLVESRPPMPNKENYVTWSSCLLRYAKSRPNGKLIQNSILNGPYVRRMIPEPGDTNRKVTVTETFHVQTDDELSDKELKHIKVDDQAIQTIPFGLPEDIYATVDSCETTQEIWLRVQQMMKGSNIGIQEKKAKNKHFPEKIASNLKFLNNLQLEWGRHVTIVHQTKDLHIADYTQLYDFLKYNQKETKDFHTADYTQLYDFLKYNQKEDILLETALSGQGESMLLDRGLPAISATAGKKKRKARKDDQ